MNTQTLTTGETIRLAANRGIANWRIGIIWIFATLIPAAIVALPVGRLIADALDHSMFAAEWAKGWDLTAIVELVTNSTDFASVLTGSEIVSVIVTLLFWPFLSAMVLSTAGDEQPPGFVALFQGGARSYGRMFRVLLWSVVPFGVAGGIGGVAVHMAHKMGEKAILESTAHHEHTAAVVFMLVLLLLAHITVEAGRAQFALDAGRRSAVKAWWRGVKLIKARPLAAFGSYLALTVGGLALMALLGWIRINVPHASLFGILLALCLTQLIVMAAVWMRASRLLALVRIGEIHGRR
jgi:hypothetical protein